MHQFSRRRFIQSLAAMSSLAVTPVRGQVSGRVWSWARVCRGSMPRYISNIWVAISLCWKREIASVAVSTHSIMLPVTPRGVAISLVAVTGG